MRNMRIDEHLMRIDEHLMRISKNRRMASPNIHHRPPHPFIKTITFWRVWAVSVASSSASQKISFHPVLPIPEPNNGAISPGPNHVKYQLGEKMSASPCVEY